MVFIKYLWGAGPWIVFSSRNFVLLKYYILLFQGYYRVPIEMIDFSRYLQDYLNFWLTYVCVWAHGWRLSFCIITWQQIFFEIQWNFLMLLQLVEFCPVSLQTLKSLIHFLNSYLIQFIVSWMYVSFFLLYNFCD